MKPLNLLVTLVSLSSTGAMAARFTVLLCAVHLGASPMMVGLIAAMFAAVAALAAVPTGRMIDRRGARRPLLVSTAVLAAAVGLGALWRELPALFIIAVLAGVAHNTMVIAFQRLAGDLAPAGERAAAFGQLGLGFSIANLAAPVVAGFAIDHTGFAATFLLFGLVPLLPLLIVWTGRLPMPVAAPHGRHAGAGAGPRRSGTLGLLRSPSLARLWVCCALFESAWMGFGFMVPIHGSNLGFSASRIGMIAGAAGVVLFLSRVFMRQLLARLSPWQLLVAGMTMIGLGFAGFAMATQFIWLAASAGLIGFGQGIASPMLNALLYECAPAHETGEALALRTLINNVSQGTIPLLAGAIGAAAGLAPVFWGLAAGMLGMSWTSRAWWQIDERAYRRRQREHQSERQRQHTRPPP